MSKLKTAGPWMLLAVGSAWWLEKFVNLEWSYPYCSVRDDGPAGAVFGFPLPYAQASIVTSVTFFFIPLLYLANLAAIALGIFLLLRPVASRLGRSKPPLIKFVVFPAGLVLFVTAVAFEAMVLSMGVWRPTASFDGMPSYSELRPVRVRTLRQQPDCTPSPFWFPNEGKKKVSNTGLN